GRRQAGATRSWIEPQKEFWRQRRATLLEEVRPQYLTSPPFVASPRPPVHRTTPRALKHARGALREHLLLLISTNVASSCRAQSTQIPAVQISAPGSRQQKAITAPISWPSPQKRHFLLSGCSEIASPTAGATFHESSPLRTIQKSIICIVLPDLVI